MSLVNHPLTTPPIKFRRDYGLNDKLYDAMVSDCRVMGSVTDVATRLIECLGWKVCLGFVYQICGDVSTRPALQIRETIKTGVTSSYASYSDSFLSIVEKHKWVKVPHLIARDKKYLKAFSDAQTEAEKERLRIEKEVLEWNKAKGVA